MRSHVPASSSFGRDEGASMGVRHFGRLGAISLIAGGVLLSAALVLAGCTVTLGSSPDTAVPHPTTTSTTPPSVPATAGGIAPEQIKELLARTAGSMQPDEWIVRDYRNLGDWAVARAYSDAFVNQDGDIGRGVVFEKRNGAWFFAGSLPLDDSEQAAIALKNMDAPKEVRNYFGEVVSTGAEEVFVEELHKQAILFGQTLDACRSQGSLQNIDDISDQLTTIRANLSGMEAPTERTNQLAGQLLRLVERLKGAADKAQAGLFSQTEFDREVLLVTDHLPLATDNIGRLLAGLDVTTTTTAH